LEDFRRMALETYSLDLTYYYSAAGFAFDAALKMTEVKIELLTDVNDYMFIEKGLRGGVNMIPKRRGTANNKYMCNYDSSKES
jgi:hypothetical protein